jgi:hypothetical protein
MFDLLKTCGVCLLLSLVTPTVVFAQTQSRSDAPAFTADRHVARGMQCVNCHGEGAQKPVAGEKCLGCHGSFDAIAKRTDGVLVPNPHAGHVGELDCTLCHNGHKANELYCSNCHKSMVVKRSAAPGASGAATK